MSVAEPENLAPRPSAKPLLWALLISVAVHAAALFAVTGLYALLVALAIISKPHNPAQLQPQTKIENNPRENLALEFVEVDPASAVKEAPKNAKYYSSQNALAANPDVKLDTDKPKIDGKQTHVIKTQSANKPKSVPLQPSAPKPVTPEGKPEAKPKASPKIGDLAMAKPADKPTDTPPDTQVGESQPKEHVRPRTLVDAHAQNKSMLGEKMKQDGGVHRPHISPSFDTKATSFGDYDAAFIDAVTKRWWDLVDNQHNSEMRSGQVALQFNLNYNGTISDMKVIGSDASDLMIYLCQRAILDPAPYAKWPNAMRQEIGSDRREIKFTFFYE